MTTQLITSGQSKTLSRVAHDAAERAAQELGLTKNAAQRVLGRGNELSLGIKRLIESLSLDLNLIQIDRTAPFDPVSFIGAGCSIAEQDERSLALTEVDLNQVTFETMLRFGEVSIEGEEKFRRLKEVGHIRLDARVLQTLYENQALIPEDWKSKDFIFFNGTIIRDSGGGQYVLCLFPLNSGWRWGYRWLDRKWQAKDLSACLVS